jgi:hypothetical protein
LISLAYVAWRFSGLGYLPQPFHYRASEPFLDVYETAAWAHRSGAYDLWRSTYPPLSFVLLKLVSIEKCYGGGAAAARACDWPPLALLLGAFLLNFALVYVTYARSNASTAIARTIAVAAGLPMLYAVERGNLLVLCFTFFVIGYGEVVRGERWRYIALAFAVNVKPYLLFSVIPPLLQRRWKWLIGFTIACGGIYFLTFVVNGEGSPAQLLGDELGYARPGDNGVFSDLYYATSLWPIIHLLRAPLPGFSALSAALTFLLTALTRVAQAGGLLCFAGAAFRPESVQLRRLGALIAAIALATFTSGSAGYGQIFLFFLIFFEPWRGRLAPIVIVFTYLLCLPLDLVVAQLGHWREVSFLSGRSVTQTAGVSVGQFARPLALIVISYALIALNFADILRGDRKSATTAGDMLQSIPRVAAAPSAR